MYIFIPENLGNGQLLKHIHYCLLDNSNNYFYLLVFIMSKYIGYALKCQGKDLCFKQKWDELTNWNFDFLKRL